MRCIAATLFFFFSIAVFAVRAQRPLIKIGWTVSRCGVYTEFSLGQEVALNFWENYTNSHGGVIVNGVTYDVKIIKYNDASDPSLGKILYQRLVEVDQVDFLLGPFNSVVPAAEVARQHQIPIISIGDYNYYSVDGAPNGTFDGYLFSANPDASTIWTGCFEVLKAKGATTYDSMFGESAVALAFDSNNKNGAQLTGIAQVGQTQVIADDLSNVSDALDYLELNTADVLVSSMLSIEDSALLLHDIRYRNLQPKAIISIVGITLSKFRETAGWQLENLFGPAAWDPVLNYTDVDFGNSQGFNEAFIAFAGRQPDSPDVVAVYGAAALKAAIERAGTLNGTQVRDVLQSLNVETFFGAANFSGPYQQTILQWYCMQADKNGTLHPVSKNAPNPEDAVYGVPVVPPPGFLPKAKKLPWKFVVLGVVLGAVLLAVVAIAAYYILYIKYSVIFISKNEVGQPDEW